MKTLPADVELDVVLGLFVLEEVEGGALGDEEEGAELELPLDGEVLDAEVLLPVVGQGLVELAVLLLGDVVRVPGPEGLSLVQLLVLCVFFLKNVKNITIKGRLLIQKETGSVNVCHLLGGAATCSKGSVQRWAKITIFDLDLQDHYW